MSALHPRPRRSAEKAAARFGGFARPALRASLALAALAAAACPSPFGPSTELRRAVIQLDTSPPAVEAPATAAAGASFVVTVTSYGGGCVDPAETRVRVEGSTATVEPYQIVRKSGVCTADLRTHVHVANVRFDTPGAARVVVRGLDAAAREVITVERVVQVQ